MNTKIIFAIITFSLFFLFASHTVASTADYLQPASTITYNEDLTVNGTGKFNSVYIGETGVGGVTFFNGTIVNIDQWTPVTFGDDVRIDGEIWGGPHKGNANDQALKIADTLLPAITGINDIGANNFRWKNIYYSGNLQGGSAEFSGEITRKSPKTEYLSISGAACSPGRGAPSQGWCQNDSGIGFVMNWDVNLPDKVDIKSFSGNLYDNLAGSMGCSLYRVDSSNPPVSNIMAGIQITSASTNWRWLTDSSINGSLVDNKKYSYHIGCSGAPTADVRASKFQIRYEKSHLD